MVDRTPCNGATPSESRIREIRTYGSMRGRRSKDLKTNRKRAMNSTKHGIIADFWSIFDPIELVGLLSTFVPVYGKIYIPEAVLFIEARWLDKETHKPASPNITFQLGKKNSNFNIDHLTRALEEEFEKKPIDHNNLFAALKILKASLDKGYIEPIEATMPLTRFAKQFPRLEELAYADLKLVEGNNSDLLVQGEWAYSMTEVFRVAQSYSLSTYFSNPYGMSVMECLASYPFYKLGRQLSFTNLLKSNLFSLEVDDIIHLATEGNAVETILELERLRKSKQDFILVIPKAIISTLTAGVSSIFEFLIALFEYQKHKENVSKKLPRGKKNGKH